MSSSEESTSLDLSPTVVAFGSTVSVGVRNYRSGINLWSAKRAASECAKIEEECAGTGKTSIALNAVSTNAVLLSVAFMEAFVNEMIDDLASSSETAISSRCKGIDPAAIGAFKELWQGPAKLDRASLLAKFQVSLIAAAKNPFDRGAQPYQNADNLITLRNSLVHFKPEWQMDNTDHKLEKRLKGLFPDSRIFPEGISPWYPNACLATGCATWAHESATKFVDTWCNKMGFEYDSTKALAGLPNED
ncbi:MULTISPECIES: hypothetical protein [Gordonia]|uniref:RiboL-PSP-HEPN domain-containing protein n=1 Tax=Gordonia sihwensis NBRC 108236 TaxID=1223544 RepID=L7LIH1_9ACTN|nr:MULTISPECIES: hypothetical protein [Gordonia]AUH68648.1 hypothetical protein CXX93_10105 [Gordonia sp. YC-JH1]GAC59863.1 hypothetical protein GSI01S_06_00180 [Gordonia sihwensis NBRC 108236]